MTEREHPEGKKEFTLYIDAKRYETTQRSITGADIKRLASIPPDYQVFLEEEGDKPDVAVSDAQGIDLEGKIKHFYAVPPATFGTFV